VGNIKGVGTPVMISMALGQPGFPARRQLQASFMNFRHTKYRES
jgi:hypothetical protein